MFSGLRSELRKTYGFFVFILSNHAAARQCSGMVKEKFDEAVSRSFLSGQVITRGCPSPVDSRRISSVGM